MSKGVAIACDVDACSAQCAVQTGFEAKLSQGCRDRFFLVFIEIIQRVRGAKAAPLRPAAKMLEEAGEL